MADRRRGRRGSARPATGIATEGTQFRFDDLVVALLEFESGLVAKVAANFGCVHPHFHASGCSAPRARSSTASTTATLWTPARRRAARRRRVDAAYPGVHKGDLIRSFVDAIVRRRAAAIVTAEDVFDALAVCFAIERARAQRATDVSVEAFG